MLSNRSNEFWNALGTPAPLDNATRLRAYMARVNQYMQTGLYYRWDFGYNSLLRYEDLEKELLKRMENN